MIYENFVSMSDNKAGNIPLRIILIGYMGSGKTTIGRALSKELNIPFYDLDRKGLKESVAVAFISISIFESGFC